MYYHFTYIIKSDISMSISLKQIKYFVATAELGQVSKAARELSVSQSAVTSAIKELESTVGDRLFSRSARGVDLSPTGRRFLEGAYRILTAVEDALQPVQSPTDARGVLNVATTYTVMGYFLPHHLERLKRLYPELDIRLHEQMREMVEEGLLTGRFDIAVLLTSNVLNPELKTETLMRSKRRLWLPTGHPLTQVDAIDFGDVAREPYIMLQVDEAAHTTLRYWQNSPYQPAVKLRTSSIEAVRSMVANGQGVTILSDMVYRPWSLEGRRIESTLLSDPVPPMEVGLAWKRGAHQEPGPAITAFSHYFSHAFQLPQLSL